MELNRFNIENWKELVKKNCKNGYSNAVFDNLIGAFAFDFKDEKVLEKQLKLKGVNFLSSWERVEEFIDQELYKRFNVL